MQYLTLVPYLAILAGVGFSYAGMLPAMIGWMISALGILFGFGLAVTAIFIGPSDLWWIAVVAALPSMVAIPKVTHDLRFPRINDVATDIEDPPSFVVALQVRTNQGRDMSFPKKNGRIIRDVYTNVQPLVLNEGVDRCFQRIENLARVQPGWKVTCCDADARTVEGEVTTAVYRFVDDFIIRVSDQDGTTRIDMRSKSRDGLVDAGANAKRILNFFEQLVNSAESVTPES